MPPNNELERLGELAAGWAMLSEDSLRVPLNGEGAVGLSGVELLLSRGEVIA